MVFSVVPMYPLEEERLGQSIDSAKVHRAIVPKNYSAIVPKYLSPEVPKYHRSEVRSLYFLLGTLWTSFIRLWYFGTLIRKRYGT
jgi:hypothetical protein